LPFRRQALHDLGLAQRLGKGRHYPNPSDGRPVQSDTARPEDQECPSPMTAGTSAVADGTQGASLATGALAGGSSREAPEPHFPGLKNRYGISLPCHLRIKF